MTYEETAALMKDATFIGRVKVACLHFADFIVNEQPSVPAHNTRYRWAQNTLNNPDSAATNITPIVVGDPQVQSDGAAISDPLLQTATETAVNKVM